MYFKFANDQLLNLAESVRAYQECTTLLFIFLPDDFSSTSFEAMKQDVGATTYFFSPECESKLIFPNRKNLGCFYPFSV
jgi:hypothetical protein